MCVAPACGHDVEKNAIFNKDRPRGEAPTPFGASVARVFGEI